MMRRANWFKRWLLHPKEHRGATRYAAPHIAAYYWNGSAPISREIKDISSTGVYLYTSERWYLGTVLSLTLQAKPDGQAEALPASVATHAKVVRHGVDGVGLKFVFMKPWYRKSLDRFLKDTVAGPKPSTPSRTFAPADGQALIEFALILPLLFLLIVNMVNFGGFFFAWITVANASRAGAQYAILDRISVGALIEATGTQVTSVIAQDTRSLLNGTNPTVNICKNNNGTITTLSGTCTGLATDPEPATYVLVSVDVTYTYNPLIPLFSFPSLGIQATLPSTTIHRRAVMRLLR